MCCRWARQPHDVQQPTATKEEAQVQDGLHQPPDLRAGEEVPLPEVPFAGGPGRDRRAAGPQQRPGHHLVPEPEGQAEEGHGGAEEGRGDGQGLRQSAEVLLGERAQLQHAQEETTSVGRGVPLHGEVIASFSVNSCTFLVKKIPPRSK